MTHQDTYRPRPRFGYVRTLSQQEELPLEGLRTGPPQRVARPPVSRAGDADGVATGVGGGAADALTRP